MADDRLVGGVDDVAELALCAQSREVARGDHAADQRQAGSFFHRVVPTLDIEEVGGIVVLDRVLETQGIGHASGHGQLVRTFEAQVAMDEEGGCHVFETHPAPGRQHRRGRAGSGVHQRVYRQGLRIDQTQQAVLHLFVRAGQP